MKRVADKNNMSSEINEIKRLLTLYYEGATTEDEERCLTTFFCRNEVPEELSADKALFSSVGLVGASEMLPEGFERRMDIAIDRISEEESRKKFGQRRIKRYASIAAGLMLLIVASVIVFGEMSRNPYEVTDEKIAYAKTQEALLKVSEKLNKVDRELAKADRLLNKLNKESK